MQKILDKMLNLNGAVAKPAKETQASSQDSSLIKKPESHH